MNHTPVKSSSVESIGYDPESQQMEVKYRSGHLYRYAGVPAAEHTKLIAAPSIGKHLAQNIRGIYQARKLAQPPKD